MTPARDRDLVASLAPTRPHDALRIARSITSVWYRTQALALVARYAQEPLASEVAREAVATARMADDAFKRVALAAWPIRALLERGEAEHAHAALRDQLTELPKVEPPSSRAEAVGLLWEAIFSAGPAAREELLTVALPLCDPNVHWRVGRLYETIALTLQESEPHRARQIADAMPHGKSRNRVARKLEDGNHLDPRPFFWPRPDPLNNTPR